MPGSPSMNGVAERRNRTLKDMVNFETGTATFFEDVEFGGRNQARNIVFEEERDLLLLLIMYRYTKIVLRGILGLSQRTYIDKVLQRYGMQNSKPGDTPIAKGDKFSLNQCPKNSLESQEMQKIPYASAVGSLMYAQQKIHIRLYLSVGWWSNFIEVCQTDTRNFIHQWKQSLSSTKSKYIDIKFLVVKEKVQSGQISIEHIGTNSMIADPLTKGLPPKVFHEHTAHMGVVSFEDIQI
ncbi:Retrovirus-related Pol polyprotein from transposon TNT 1-94 [Vitis vinifera]|uniref:Retrovirus-related Pol polyprotein from transposon TNT 1-94 n=1 Tax=Vitis vinifera TaxID=29760 RepID=A0A438FUP2_VITVI|nr:Retrovirus-related Pol polyprotein from transposon TNT 1-94 [Vitis vinifera]